MQFEHRKTVAICRRAKTQNGDKCYRIVWQTAPTVFSQLAEDKAEVQQNREKVVKNGNLPSVYLSAVEAWKAIAQVNSYDLWQL